MPLRFLALISALALLVGAFAGWFARAAAEELNAAETAGSGFVRRPTRSGPASGTGRDGRSPDELTPGPVFDIGGASAAGAMVQRANEERWWNAVVMLAEAERIAAQNVGPGQGDTRRESASSHATSLRPGPAPSTGSGDCSGYPSHVPIQRESGGDPNAVNSSSGAMGCAQVMPLHFRPGGTCADLSTDYEGQRECAWRLPASAWAG